MDYTIRSGDTLTAIARRFGTTVQALAQANGISNPDRIGAGQTIRVPSTAATDTGQPTGPTMGATPLPRPRPDQAAPGVPLPRENPGRPNPPIPPANPTRPGVNSMASQPLGPMPLGATQGPSRMAGLPMGPNSMQAEQLGPPRTGLGFPSDLSGIPTNRLAALVTEAQTPEQVQALHAEVERRRQQAMTQGRMATTDVPGQQAMRRDIGVDMRPNPAPQLNRSIGGGEPYGLEIAPGAPAGPAYGMQQANTLLPPGGYPPQPQGPVSGLQPGGFPPGGAPQGIPGAFGLGGQPGMMPTMGQGEGNPMQQMLIQMLLSGAGQQGQSPTLIPALMQQLQGAR